MKKGHLYRYLLGVAAILACLLPLIAARAAAAPKTNQAGAAAPQSAPGTPLGRIEQAAGGRIEMTLSRATGRASFLAIEPGALPFAMQGKGEDAARQRAQDFLSAYGDVFGILDLHSELHVVSAQKDSTGGWTVRLSQVHQGVPVFAGELRVHFNAQGELTAANGIFVPELDVNVTPDLTPAQAAEIARQVVEAQVAAESQASMILQTGEPMLYVFRTNLAKGAAGVGKLIFEVEVTGEEGVREWVYVDAHDGQIVDQISGTTEIMRKIYDKRISSATLVWQDGNPPYSGTDQGVKRLIDYAEDTYNLFSSMTNGAYKSYNGLDAEMISVANVPAMPCPNANWNGTSTNFCKNVDGDDTVAHEWAHAYTEKTHALIYQWQSGALNESYSDIWGEVVDLLNADGADTPGGLRTDNSCSSLQPSSGPDNTYRWLSGEDDAAMGVIRDMWKPSCLGDPDKVTDTRYACDLSLSDGGGVHTNSGIPNHAFALIVDGGNFNGQAISGIGLTKAAHIYWRAQTEYQTLVTDFSDHAAALQQSCYDLVGQPLYALSTDRPTSAYASDVITGADCTQVQKATLAVEMNAAPNCAFEPMLDPNTPAVCTTAGQVAVPVTKTDWEGGLSDWTVGQRAVVKPSTFNSPHWYVAGPLPDGREGFAAFADNDASLGNCSDDDESGVIYLESSDIYLPASVSDPLLTFDHWVATETDFDGGNLKISVNGGAWTLVPSSAYKFNPYNGSLVVTDNTDPLKGEAAFHGTDGGKNSGSWYQSQVNLKNLAAPGSTIRLRFELGKDGCNGIIGWYVDDVQVVRCAAEAPDPVYVDDDYSSTTGGFGIDHFKQITDGLHAVRPGGMVHVAAGSYPGTLVVRRPVTVSMAGDVTLGGGLSLLDGALIAPPGTLTLQGDFTAAGGVAFNANGGTLVFSGSPSITLALYEALSFHNLTVGSGVTLVETEGPDNATLTGTLTNNGVISKTGFIPEPGVFTFGLTGAQVEVVTPGSLHTLQVDRVDANHPQASSDNLRTGRYWTLTPNAEAGGFNVDLTLAVNFAPQADGSDKLCRYTASAGDPSPFECGQAAETSGDPAAMTLTRRGVTGFSTWTAGRDTSPTALTLAGMTARAGALRWPLPALTLALLALLALIAAGGWLLRRSRAAGR